MNAPRADARRDRPTLRASNSTSCAKTHLNYGLQLFRQTFEYHPMFFRFKESRR